MQRTIATFKVLALGSASLLMLAGVFLFVQLSGTVKRFEDAGAIGHLNNVLDQLDTGLSTTFVTLNRPCGRKDDQGRLLPCGTLAEAGRTAEGADDVLKGADLLRRNEQRTLDQNIQPTIDRFNRSLDNFQTATGDFHPLMTELTARTKALGPVEANAADAIATLNSRLADPHIKHMVEQADEASVKANSAAGELDQAAAEGRQTAEHFNAISANAEVESNRVVHPFACWHLPWHGKPSGCVKVR